MSYTVQNISNVLTCFPLSREGETSPALPLPERPPFPPTELQLAAAFPPELGDALGSELLMVWAFLHSFGELLGLWPATVDELLTAFALGERSRLLGEIHVGLLRLLQADMEEAHASGVSQVCVHKIKGQRTSKGVRTLGKGKGVHLPPTAFQSTSPAAIAIDCSVLCMSSKP